MKTKYIYFTDQFDPAEYDRRPLPMDIYNSEGAVLAHRGSCVPRDRLVNTFIRVDETQSPLRDAAKELPADSCRSTGREAANAIDECYEEEDADEISRRLNELPFEPVPVVKEALHGTIHNLKEIYRKHIVNNVVTLVSQNNERLSGFIAEYLDELLDNNLYAADYLDMITAIRTRDNYVTFAHAAAVSFYTMAIARKLRLLHEDLAADDHRGRWRAVKTAKHPEAGAIRLVSRQMLQYIDRQKAAIAARYDTDVQERLFEIIHDLMHGYARLDPATRYPSLAPHYDESFRRLLTMAAMNIDIGKICIPNRILYKPESLADDEWQIIKQHPVFSVMKLKEVSVDNAKLFAYIIAHHMLSQDRGYPSQRETPPPEVKIITVCDMYDAMRSSRHYGRLATQEEALAAVGQLYDEEIIDLPLYLTAVHTFEEYNHEFVTRRLQTVVQSTENPME